jgi:hypothetical protein
MKKLVFALICGVILVSCEKESDVNGTDDTFVGTYTTTCLDGYFSMSTTPTIELRNGKYTYNGLSNGGYFDIGGGNFTIKGNKIIFELTHIDHDPSVPTNVDLVLPDWHNDWLFNGEYKYKQDGNKLILSKTTTVNTRMYRFEFELEKK